MKLKVSRYWLLLVIWTAVNTIIVAISYAMQRDAHLLEETRKQAKIDLWGLEDIAP